MAELLLIQHPCSNIPPLLRGWPSPVAPSHFRRALSGWLGVGDEGSLPSQCLWPGGCVCGRAVGIGTRPAIQDHFGWCARRPAAPIQRVALPAVLAGRCKDCTIRERLDLAPVHPPNCSWHHPAGPCSHPIQGEADQSTKAPGAPPASTPHAFRGGQRQTQSLAGASNPLSPPPAKSSPSQLGPALWAVGSRSW